MNEDLKRLDYISPRDYLAEKTGVLWLKINLALNEAADFAPAEIGDLLKARASDSLRMAALSDNVANDAHLFNFHNSSERVLDEHFELRELLKPYLGFDAGDTYKLRPIEANCGWAAPLVAYWELVSDISWMIEEINIRLITLLSLAPDEKIKELELTREELEATRANNPFGFPKGVSDFDSRAIFDLAQRNGYKGGKRQLLANLANWKADEREPREKWLLTREEIEQFLRYLSGIQRGKP